MKEKATITVIICEAAVQCNISRNTTCDDIIKMATRKLSSLNGTKGFAIFESAFGVQKMLPGQTKLMKQVRSWGADSHNFTLEVREVDKLKTKMASITRAKTKLQRLRSFLMKHDLKDGQKFESYLHDNIASNCVNKDKKTYDKNITVIQETVKMCSSEVEVNCKKELLQRYLNDSVKNNVNSGSDSDGIQLSARTGGVGCETFSVIKSEIPERTPGDGEESLDDITEADDEHYMNKAFICGETINGNKSYNKNEELNECILFDSDDSHLENDESAFEDDSDYDSICELERNIIESYADTTYTKIDELKRIFSNDDLNARITEDELLDSFMNTFVHNDDDSDEGMDSVHSDFE